MGREIKRVPLDLDAPLNKPWHGYVMPDELDLPPCGDCNRTGRDSTYQWVEAITRMLLMLGGDASEQQRGRRLHPYLQDLTYHVYTDRRPNPESAVALSTGLAGRAPRAWGHDSIDGWAATKKVIEAAGLDLDTWAVCTTCNGRGHLGSDELVAAHEAWERTDPPAGDGWQLWGTVSEGSPISPVFATAAELAGWMSDPARGDEWVPGDVAAKFIGFGWAPSGFIGPEDAGSGVEFVGTTAADGEAADQ